MYFIRKGVRAWKLIHVTNQQRRGREQAPIGVAGFANFPVDEKKFVS